MYKSYIVSVCRWADLKSWLYQSKPKSAFTPEMNFGGDMINEDEFPGIAGNIAAQYSSEESDIDDKEPAPVVKKEKGSARKIKKRGSLFGSRFAKEKKEKDKDPAKLDKKSRSKSQDWDGKKEKVEEKKKEKVEEKKKEKGEEKKKEKGEEKKKKKEGRGLKRNLIPLVGHQQLVAARNAAKAAEVKPVFGIPLAEAVEHSKMYDGVELPRVFRECLDYVEEHGLNYAGIYRLAGVKSKVEHLKAEYNSNKDVNLKDYDPTIVTSLLKLYLRELPESVLTTALLPQFEEASKIEDEQSKLEVFQMVMQGLPPCNYALLSWMVIHLAHVLEMESETKMTIQNISIVMCPTMRISHRVLNLLFQHYKALFRGVQIKKCKKLLKWHPNIVSELPDDPVALEEELQRHEAILNKMHDDLQKGVANKSTEDELWEVQRVVTQLKRKLRVSRRVSETRIAEKEKEQQKVKEHEVKEVKVEKAPIPAAAGKTDKEPIPKVARKAEKIERKSPKRRSQKGPAPKIPELPPKQAERPEEPVETAPVEPPAPAPAPAIVAAIEVEKKKPETQQVEDKIEADLKKVAEKLEKEGPKYETQSSVASSTSTKEKMEELKSGDGIKRDFPEELTDTDSDENDFEQLYDIPPAPIVAAPIIPDKQSKAQAPGVPEPTADDSIIQQEDMEMIRLLLLSQAEVFAEQEELTAIRNELQKRIESERQEIERLKQEVAEAQNKRLSRSSSIDSFEESLVSVDSSSSESGDEEELMEMMNSLMLENQELERKNTLLSHDIHNEREAVVELKVKIKLLQEAGPRILAEAELGDPTDQNQSLQAWLDKADTESTDSSVFDGGTHRKKAENGEAKKRKAETLPKMSRPMYGEHSQGESPGRKLERETSV
ncbi:LOW QUALITY PROTEIN: uncharacterized protein [Amphiura filiformis]|uniref:LOW QUALITY PROTEIN: uncharacterized protein n=1 Tax=Amphiura filiformis TaxID=82378 RepID=UPI003B21A88F